MSDIALDDGPDAYDPDTRAPDGVDASRDRRAWAASLSDRALVVAMATGDDHAWLEFDTRFRPVLRRFVQSVSMNGGLVSADVRNLLIDEILAQESMRLTGPAAPVVPVLVPYLVRAARNRLCNLRRDTRRRLRRYMDAASISSRGSSVRESADGRVVAALCSEHLLRTCDGDPIDANAALADWPAQG